MYVPFFSHDEVPTFTSKEAKLRNVSVSVQFFLFESQSNPKQKLNISVTDPREVHFAPNKSKTNPRQKPEIICDRPWVWVEFIRVKIQATSKQRANTSLTKTKQTRDRAWGLRFSSDKSQTMSKLKTNKIQTKTKQICDRAWGSDSLQTNPK